jgi:predicted metal-dependent peptidase
MQTDGTVLAYSAEFVDTLTDAELTGVMAHEVLHCALRHMYRTGGRDMQEWNIAADYVINQELIAHGFTLPKGALIDSQYSGMSAEQVYSLRGRSKQQSQQSQQSQQPNGNSSQAMPSTSASGAPPNSSGNGSSCPTGTFTTPQTPDASGQTPVNGQTPIDTMSAHDWEIATEQASLIASKAGKMSGGVARAIKTSRESIEDWRAILREFIEHQTPSDYSWTQPNRRYIGAGIYLPGTVRENLPSIAIGVDTSGSITPDMLNLFAVELTAILHESRPDSIEVIYCDSEVNGTASYSPDDPAVTLTPMGGGGTRFSPVFEHIATWDLPPACLVYFTDLESYDTPTEPDYPTLWVTPESTRLVAPFGRTVRLSQWD